MRKSERIMRITKALSGLMLSASIVTTEPSVAAPSSEIQALTVAFLYNFMKLSEWPPQTITNEFTLCAIQSSDYSIDVDSLAGKEVQSYTLKIRHLMQGDSIEGCQLLYIPEDEKPIRLREWLKIMDKKPLLSVSSTPGFLDQGGMIELVSEGDHLLFEVNLTPVEQAGIKISSKMLQIAREVQGNP
ncbi:MAG: YfiR family protein [Methylococcaceae bacterium]|nr:YfiR family protein [Methylococcaceae bacterium]